MHTMGIFKQEMTLVSGGTTSEKLRNVVKSIGGLASPTSEASYCNKIPGLGAYQNFTSVIDSTRDK